MLFIIAMKPSQGLQLWEESQDHNITNNTKAGILAYKLIPAAIPIMVTRENLQLQEGTEGNNITSNTKADTLVMKLVLIVVIEDRTNTDSKY
jgi:hypothetical protein